MNMSSGMRLDGRRPLAAHHGQFSAGGWSWYVGGILLLAAVANLVNGNPRGPAGAASAASPASALGYAALSALAGILFLVMPVLRWRQRVDVFDDGFVWTRLLGTRSVRRDEVRGVRRIDHISRSVRYTEVEVQLDGGRTLSISGIENAEQLANMLVAFAQSPSAPAAGARGWTPPAPGGWTPPRS
jgi:hypothetical protein